MVMWEMDTHQPLAFDLGLSISIDGSVGRASKNRDNCAISMCFMLEDQDW